MTILLSADDIKRIVSEPTKLPPSSSADDYLMERYQKVAMEAAANAMACSGACPLDDRECEDSGFDCPACWRAYLEREAK